MNNKFVLFILFVILASLGSSFAQTEKKPTLMILPSDNWCTQRYFTTTYEFQGVKTRVPNYQQAFQEDTELPLVISKVGQLLTAKGYSIKDAEQEIKNIAQREAESNVTTSKASGAMMTETPLDILKRRIKSDVVIQIWWQVNKNNSISFALEAFDSYTSKRIATSTGIVERAGDIPHTLEVAVGKNIQDFDLQMMQWYERLNNTGREIVIWVKCWDSWDKDLETEYDGVELVDCIQSWLRENTVNGAFNLSDATEVMAQFEMVMIPLSENEQALDARGFATKLRKHLQKSPYNIQSKVLIRGLGEATIILGEK